jgi:hypothetical protein
MGPDEDVPRRHPASLTPSRSQRHSPPTGGCAVLYDTGARALPFEIGPDGKESGHEPHRTIWHAKGETEELKQDLTIDRCRPAPPGPSERSFHDGEPTLFTCAMRQMAIRAAILGSLQLDRLIEQGL